MSVTNIVLINNKFLEAAQTTQYTSSSGKTIIDKCTIVNTGASNVAFSINLVPSAGSASSSNLLINSRTLAPNDSYGCPEIIGQVLESGGFISTISGSAGVLSIYSSGRLITTS